MKGRGGGSGGEQPKIDLAGAVLSMGTYKRAVSVHGDTWPHRDALVAIGGGKWIPSLGFWTFPPSKRDAVARYVNATNNAFRLNSTPGSGSSSPSSNLQSSLSSSIASSSRVSSPSPSPSSPSPLPSPSYLPSPSSPSPQSPSSSYLPSPSSPSPSPSPSPSTDTPALSSPTLSLSPTGRVSQSPSNSLPQPALPPHSTISTPSPSPMYPIPLPSSLASPSLRPPPTVPTPPLSSVPILGEPIMKFSDEQERVFQWTHEGHGHAIIEAVAGAGKSTTLLEAARRIVTHQDPQRAASILFTCFNKSAATQLSERLAQNRLDQYATACTLHSLGKRLFLQTRRLYRSYGGGQRQYGGPQESPSLQERLNKLGGQQPKKNLLAMQVLGKDKSTWRLRNALVRVAAMAQVTLTDPRDSLAVEALFDRFCGDLNVDLELQGRLISELPGFLQKCADFGAIDFDDMVWLPNYLDIQPKHSYNWIFVDEAQDLNLAQIGLIERLVETVPECRVVAVGDPNQSIYSFNGAAHGSMDKFAEHMEEWAGVKPAILQLCHTRRCPPQHLVLAQQIVPHISPADNVHPDGLCSTCSIEEALPMVCPGDLVISRRNKPIVRAASELVKRGVPAAIVSEGQLAAGMIAMVKDIKADSTLGLRERLKECRETEMNALTRRGMWNRMGFVKDFYKCLIWLSKHQETPQHVLEHLERIFHTEIDELVDVVRLSSVHRAKGAEADTVWILRPDLFFTPPRGKEDIYRDRDGWAYQEERNILYVALTRSKKRLFLVGDPFRKEAGISLSAIEGGPIPELNG